MELLVALLPLIILCAAVLAVVFGVIAIRSLSVRMLSRRLKLVRRAHGEFLRGVATIPNGPIRVHASARSKKDLKSWDFAYQRNRWIAENQQLIRQSSEAHLKNSELHGQILSRLQPELEVTKELSFFLRRLERKKVERTLRQLDWPHSLVLHMTANYTSPAGRINISESDVYVHELGASNGLKAASSKTLPVLFDDPKKLQFPGVYVYSYPSFMEGRSVFPMKIGKSESSVHARVRQQISQGGAAIPEDPIIICAMRFDQGAGTAESLLHVSFKNARTKGGGTEWFSIGLKDLRDELAARGYSATWNSALNSPRFAATWSHKATGEPGR